MNSYAGLRTIQLAKEGEKQIILLNGKPLDFQVETRPQFVHYPYAGSNMKSWLKFLFLESRPCPRHLYLTRFCHSCFIVEFRMFGMDELCGQVGPLDQGYWPDGLLTPPSEDAIRQLLTLLLLSFAEIKQNTGNIMSDLDDG